LPGWIARRIKRKCHMNVKWRTEYAGTGNYSGAVSFRTSLVLDFARSVWSGHFFLWDGFAKGGVAGVIGAVACWRYWWVESAWAVGLAKCQHHTCPPYGIRCVSAFRMNSPSTVIVRVRGSRMNSLLTLTVGWALVPTRIMRTDNSAGNSPINRCVRGQKITATPTSGSAPLPPTLP